VNFKVGDCKIGEEEIRLINYDKENKILEAKV